MGISAQELRIGNYILDETGVITIIVAIDSERKFWNEIIQKEFKATARLIMLDNFDWNTSYGCWVEKLKPIPITEEWLYNFGFEKNENGVFKLFKYSEVEILIKDGYWTCDGICFSVNSLDYIHQLQNLFHALTGEELELKTI